mmetsp:Transcript_6253/g.9079  ORF Transcript_6253/g.9079 Transcript_6253/m.9079 type:complete len:618 (+) Transcript_6253:80-1933(+)|eukprot:CAMPEP_0184867026 /NCGR_PEP_ID=MMETSP0580-20130426/24771_1 /TAXON_ID=1118495 /ORGANISM="Dactyliosolen fragilissimus" /LENGTH=617 /DNA_ID=CAMNT_0027367021 /DNA_START=60 /DNA_END=1909 /DNA_ORIENTATION=+
MKPKTSSSSSTSSSLTSHDLFSHLETLPRDFLLSLYTDKTRGQYAAKTILQRLPEVARQYVIRLAVCGGSFPLSEIRSWSSRRGRMDAILALERMEALCVSEPLSKRSSEKDGEEDVEEYQEGEGGIGRNAAFWLFSDSNVTKRKMIQLSHEFKNAICESLTSLQSSPWSEVTDEMHEQLRRLEEEKRKNPEYVQKNKSSKYASVAPTFEELETFTQKRWDSVLHFLVGTDAVDAMAANMASQTASDKNNTSHAKKIARKKYDDPPDAVIHFLEQTGLMQEDPDWTRKIKDERPPLVITSKGYEFMLCDVHVQVWQFILQYFHRLSSHPNGKELKKEALLFLLCLSYCRVGMAYSASSLGKDSKVLMRDFAHFGLLYVCRIGGVTLFYPTRVAVNLVVASLTDVNPTSKLNQQLNNNKNDSSHQTSSAALANSASATRALETALASPTPSDAHVAIIVQTNFQVCAYTTSPLHVSMLGLFCDISNFRRLPNVIFYRITRDSIKGAFRLGIEADQILRFLKMHAHPKLRTGNQPLIPSNIEDQIILWDRERTRVQMTEIYSLQCRSKDEYKAVKQYVLDKDAFGWSNDAKNLILIKYSQAELVLGFVGRWRTRMAQHR